MSPTIALGATYLAAAVGGVLSAATSREAGTSALWVAVAAFVGGSAFAGIVAGIFTRQLTKAQTRGAAAEARQSDAVAVGKWIENNERQAERIGRLEKSNEKVAREFAAYRAAADSKHDQLQTQIDQLVERERHQLARAVAHSVWDDVMIRAAQARGESFPEPPLLYTRAEVDDDGTAL